MLTCRLSLSHSSCLHTAVLLQPRVQLFRYDVEARRFDAYLPGLSAGPVDFSFDRKWITYVLYPEMTLWRSKLDGSEKMQLTFPPVRAYGPRWSPDDAQIVYTDLQYDPTWKIGLVSRAGGSSQVLLQDDINLGDPNWMPDGKSIVFAKFDRMGKGALHQLDLKTKEVSSISDSEGLFSPRVSPDGRYISAVTIIQTELMLFDRETKQWSILVEGDQLGYNEWSMTGNISTCGKTETGLGNWYV